MCWLLRCKCSIACRSCSNYIFILDTWLQYIAQRQLQYKTRNISYVIWCILYYTFYSTKYLLYYHLNEKTTMPLFNCFDSPILYLIGPSRDEGMTQGEHMSPITALGQVIIMPYMVTGHLSWSHTAPWDTWGDLVPLTYCDLVMPCGHIDLWQYWLR